MKEAVCPQSRLSRSESLQFRDFPSGKRSCCCATRHSGASGTRIGMLAYRTPNEYLVAQEAA